MQQHALKNFFDYVLRYSVTSVFFQTAADLQRQPGKFRSGYADLHSAAEKIIHLFQTCIPIPENFVGIKQGCLPVPEKFFAIKQGCLPIAEKFFGIKQGCLTLPEKFFGIKQGCLTLPEKFFNTQHIHIQ